MNIFDVFKSIYAIPSASSDSPDSPQINSSQLVRRPGFAEHQRHPFCYITVKPEVFVNRHVGAFTEGENPWMLDRCVHTISASLGRSFPMDILLICAELIRCII